MKNNINNRFFCSSAVFVHKEIVDCSTTPSTSTMYCKQQGRFSRVVLTHKECCGFFQPYGYVGQVAKILDSHMVD